MLFWVSSDVKMGCIEDKQSKPLLKSTKEDVVKQRDDQDPKRQSSLRVLGLLFALGSAFSYSFQSLIINFVTEISPIQFAFICSSGLFCFSSVILISQRRSPWLQEKRLNILVRCVMGAASFITGNIAFRYLPLGDASVVIFSAPIFVTVFAYCILKESFTIFHLVVNLITLVGVTLVVRPPFLFGGHAYDSHDSIIGISFALINIVFSAGVYISMRTLVDMHYSIIIFYISVIGTLSFGVLSLYLGTFIFVVSKNFQIFVFAAPVAHILGQFLLTKALQLEDAGPVSMIRSADIVFAFLWQYLFLGVAPNMMSIGGANLVIFSVILMGFRKMVDGAEDDSKIVKYCWYFKI